MALAIEVYRDAGDRPGDEVRDDLLGDSLTAALARGRGELDAQAHARGTTTLELAAPRLDLRLGDLIAVSDPSQGVAWRGKVVGLRHGLTLGDAPTVLTVERVEPGAAA